jgi:hypothetical protein
LPSRGLHCNHLLFFLFCCFQTSFEAYSTVQFENLLSNRFKSTWRFAAELTDDFLQIREYLVGQLSNDASALSPEEELDSRRHALKLLVVHQVSVAWQ